MGHSPQAGYPQRAGIWNTCMRLCPDPHRSWVVCSRPSALPTCCQPIACLLFPLEPAAGLFSCTFRTQVAWNKLSSNYPITNYSLYLITEIIRKRTIQCKHKLYAHLSYCRLQNTLRELYIYIFFSYDRHYSFLNYLPNSNSNLHLNDMLLMKSSTWYVCVYVYTHINCSY